MFEQISCSLKAYIQIYQLQEYTFGIIVEADMGQGILLKRELFGVFHSNISNKKQTTLKPRTDS